MDTPLSTLYATTGYPSASDFRKIARSEQYPKAEIDTFLAANNATSIFKKPKPDPDRHYSHTSYKYVFMIDLMDVSKYSRYNKGYNWILNAIEWHSRRAFAIPLATKEAGPIADAVEELINLIPNSHVAPIRIVSDRGKEFVNKAFSAILKGRPNIFRLLTTATRKSTNPVERFNRTLWTAFARKWTAEGNVAGNGPNFKWYDFLDTFIRQYNNRPHSATGIEPMVAWENPPTPFIDLNNVRPKAFPVGSWVRYKEPKALFDKKSAAPVWSSTVHQVEEINGDLYKISNADDEWFEESQLIAAPEPEETTPKSESGERAAPTFRQEQAKVASANRQKRTLAAELGADHESRVIEQPHRQQRGATLAKLRQLTSAAK